MGVKKLSGQVRLRDKESTVLLRFSGRVTRATFDGLKMDVRKLAKRSGLTLKKFTLKRAGGKRTKRAKKK